MAGARDPLRDDPDLRRARGYETGTVGAEEPGLRISPEEILDPDHVLDRDPFGDAHDQLDSVGRSFHDSVGCKRRRHEDPGCVGIGGANRFRNRVEHRYAHVRGPAFAGAGAADDVGAHLAHLLGVKGSLTPGDALDDDAGAGVEENAHLAAGVLVSSTIFCAASHALTPGSMPAWRRIARPSSSRVPLRRTTSGSFICNRSRAVTMPFATSSPRVMPPKTLISTPLTRGFMRMTERAFSTVSAFAPPPMSQKLAAFPPALWTRSSVLMHSPAPLPMMPISPSSETYVRPRFLASTSRGSPSITSPNCCSRSLCLHAAFSSISSLASPATTSPAFVITRGLISAVTASSSGIAR